VKKFLLAPLMTLGIVASVIGIGIAMKPEPVQAAPVVAAAEKCKDILLGLPVGTICAEQDGMNVLVKLNDATIISLPLSNVQLPPVTVSVPRTVRVTLPRVTITRPPVTIRPPGVTLPRQTVTVNLPRATRTVTLPGEAGSTVTVTLPREGAAPPRVVPVTITASNGQTIQTSVTITPSPVAGPITTKAGVTVERKKEVRVSVPTAIGIGIGVLVLGLLLGLLAIYMAYVAGYKDSEQAEASAWQKFRADVFGKKNEGEN
jgi:hypothetical protein